VVAGIDQFTLNRDDVCLSKFSTEKARDNGLFFVNEGNNLNFIKEFSPERYSRFRSVCEPKYAKPTFMGILPAGTKLAKLYDPAYVN